MTEEERAIEFLSKLDEGARMRLAIDTASSADWLRRLSKDESHDVRSGVAFNRRTPEEVLAELAQDRNAVVRHVVAMNKNTPLEILKRMTADTDEAVRCFVTEKIRIRESVLKRCIYCNRPEATPEDWKNIPENEGEHLCWGECAESFDPEGVIVKLRREIAELRNNQ